MDLWHSNYTTMKQGKDVIIHPSSIIKRPHLVEVGDHVSIDVGVYLSTRAKIGNYVHIAPYVCIIGGGDAVLIMEDFSNISAGAKVVVLSDDFTAGMINPIVPVKYRNLVGGVVRMERFTVVGANSVVLPGITMAEGSVVGANSTLTKDTEPWTVYVGSPARPTKKRDNKLIFESIKKMGYV